MSLAFGSISRLFTRQMYYFIENRKSWNELVDIPRQVKEELQFWDECLYENNGFRIKSNHLTTKISYSDASAFGYGGFIVDRLEKIISQGAFTQSEMATSSTYRELLAVKYILQSVGFLIRNQSVQWNSDNLNATKIIDVGSSKSYLHNIAVDIYKLCLCYDIEIFHRWIPREENDIADKISKLSDNDNWSIDSATFNLIRKVFGEFTVDRFADNINSKVRRFNSKYITVPTAKTLTHLLATGEKSLIGYVYQFL